jgi:hypothetical protein
MQTTIINAKPPRTPPRIAPRFVLDLLVLSIVAVVGVDVLDAVEVVEKVVEVEGSLPGNNTNPRLGDSLSFDT